MNDYRETMAVWHDTRPEHDERGDRLDERTSMEMLAIVLVICAVILALALAHVVGRMA